MSIEHVRTPWRVRYLVSRVSGPVALECLVPEYMLPDALGEGASGQNGHLAALLEPRGARALAAQLHDDIQVPWQVRYRRWWWLRESVLERLGGRRDSAERSRGYAMDAVPWWRRTGQLPPVLCSEGAALKRMRTPPGLAARLMYPSTLLPSSCAAGGRA
ncbi:hypothetical protein LXT21_41640 [Myxococcus sp. K38C18041901]|uniref:hypothetical protein n=1 Tax=Myxococcus guangdongensis TaxID=2906760 RepID=UPI0020A81899|nr:hypothetical protein [Myxococcus guangdongensis]MCP3065295.1 hypothetical protein [Myxococcus guangdongensis]